MKKLLKSYILFYVLFIPFIMVNGSEYSFKIKFLEFGGDLDPIVSIIDESGNNIIVGNSAGIKSQIHRENISIVKREKFGEYSYNIKLKNNIENECQLWLRNTFQEDNYDSGRELFDTEIIIYKNNVEIGKIALLSKSGKKYLTSTIKGIRIPFYEVSPNKSGLWKLCTIIPKYDKILLVNDFYERSKVVVGKVWNTKTKKPVINAEIIKNKTVVTKTDSMGSYSFPYSFNEQNLEIYAKYKNTESNIINFITIDGFPRTGNLFLAYQPKPPLPENFRKKFYLNFAFNSDVLEKNSTNQNIFHQIKKIIESYTIQGKIIIEGHTDNIGSENYNYDLSYRRATSVVNIIKKMKIGNLSFEISGFGEDNPISDNSTENGRERNRRVELVFRYIKNNK